MKKEMVKNKRTTPERERLWPEPFAGHVTGYVKDCGGCGCQLTLALSAEGSSDRDAM